MKLFEEIWRRAVLSAINSQHHLRRISEQIQLAGRESPKPFFVLLEPDTEVGFWMLREREVKIYAHGEESDPVILLIGI